MPRILVTGAGGFIGFHLCRRLLRNGHHVLGIDNFCDDGALDLKPARATELEGHKGFRMLTAAIETPDLLAGCFDTFKPEIVAHLAARAGVRQSICDPQPYIDSNILGAQALLEAARCHPPKHLLMASSSSVYGGANSLPFSEHEKTDMPLSLYAATKKAGEALAHSYAHLFDLPITMLRFFTVYGPWGRPDMAMIRFTRAIMAGEEVALFNHGKMLRDFTYIDDLVQSLILLIDRPPHGQSLGAVDNLSPVAPYRCVNIGSADPVTLDHLIDVLEGVIGKPARRNYQPLQAGDMVETAAYQKLLRALVGFAPRTPLPEGLPVFVDWYRGYYLSALTA